MFRIAAEGGDPQPLVETLFLGFWTLSTVLVIAPVTLVSAIGEIAGARSFLLYGGATALLTAAIPWIARGGVGDPTALSAEGRLTAILFGRRARWRAGLIGRCGRAAAPGGSPRRRALQIIAARLLRDHDRSEFGVA